MKLKLVQLEEWYQLEPLQKEVYMLSGGEFNIYEELSLYMRNVTEQDLWTGKGYYAYEYYIDYWIAIDEDSNETIGLTGAIYCRKTKKSKMVAILGWLVLGEDYRGKGLGSQILKLTEDQMKKVDVDEIFVAADVWSYNAEEEEWYVDESKKVVEFYKKNGYEVLGTFDEIDFSKFESYTRDEWLAGGPTDVICYKKVK